MPRFSLLLHYQVSRPGIFSVLLLECTSPSESLPEHVAAARLHGAFSGAKSQALSRRAAEYAVDMARSFGFLAEGLSWSWKGHVIGAIVREVKGEGMGMAEYLNLSRAEIIAFLRYYLETQGAVLLEVGRLLCERREISQAEFLQENLIEKVYEGIWKGYLPLAAELQDRLRIREKLAEMERYKCRRYQPEVRRHKVLPIVGAMVDFGLVETVGRKDKRQFVVRETTEGVPLERLVEELGDFATMERRLVNGEYYPIIRSCLGISAPSESPEREGTVIKRELVKAYQAVKQEPSGLASIAAMEDLVSVKMLSSEGNVITKGIVFELLEGAKVIEPTAIRFHVDRQGKRAYVVMSERGILNLTPGSATHRGSAV